MSTLQLKSVKEIELEIAQEFEIFDNWMDRYEYIIDLGKLLTSFPDESKRIKFMVVNHRSGSRLS